MLKATARVVLLSGSYGAAAIANFLLSVSVGHRLGAEALGIYATGVSISRVFYSATSLGLGIHLTRSVARDRGLSHELTDLFVGARVLLIPIGIAVTIAAGTLLGEDAFVVLGLLAATQGLITLQLLYEALFFAYEKPRAVSVLTLLSSLCVATACLSWWFGFRGDLLLFSVAYAAGTGLGLATWLVHAGRRLGYWPRPRWDAARLRLEIAHALPIGISEVLSIATLKAPILVLSAFCGRVEVGAYASAELFVTASAIFQIAVTGVVFPKLAVTFKTDPARFRTVLWLSNAVLAAGGILVALVLTFWGQWMVELLFPGRDFSAARDLMPVVAWSVPCLLLAHHNVYAYAAADQQRTNALLMFAWFGFGTAAQLVLVPLYGVVGAGWGLLVGRLAGLAFIATVCLANPTYLGRGQKGAASADGG